MFAFAHMRCCATAPVPHSAQCQTFSISLPVMHRQCCEADGLSWWEGKPHLNRPQRHQIWDVVLFQLQCPSFQGRKSHLQMHPIFPSFTVLLWQCNTVYFGDTTPDVYHSEWEQSLVLSLPQWAELPARHPSACPALTADLQSRGHSMCIPAAGRQVQVCASQGVQGLINDSWSLLCTYLCSPPHPQLGNYSHKIEYKSRWLIFLLKISQSNQILKCIFSSSGFISKSHFYHLSAKVRFKHPHCNVWKMNICFAGYCANQ